MSPCRYGVHWPPLVLISHLHLHIIAPEGAISFMGRLFFRPNSYWFSTVSSSFTYPLVPCIVSNRQLYTAGSNYLTPFVFSPERGFPHLFRFSLTHPHPSHALHCDSQHWFSYLLTVPLLLSVRGQLLSVKHSEAIRPIVFLPTNSSSSLIIISGLQCCCLQTFSTASLPKPLLRC